MLLTLPVDADVDGPQVEDLVRDICPRTPQAESMIVRCAGREWHYKVKLDLFSMGHDEAEAILTHNDMLPEEAVWTDEF